MDDLPLEIKIIIFKFIPIVDIIKYQIVSKKWKFIIDNYLVFDSLHLVDEFYGTRPNDLIVIKIETFYSEFPKNHLFKKVKKIKFCFYNHPLNDPLKDEFTSPFFNFFNQFQYLECLILDLCGNVFPNFIVLNINSENLKKLKIKAIFFRGLEISAPQLTHLKTCYGLDHSKIENTKNLIYLKMHADDRKYQQYLNPHLSSKLEILKFNECDYLLEAELEKFLLIFSKFNKLKELHISSSFRFKNTIISYFLNFSERSKFKIYYRGFDLRCYKDYFGDNYEEMSKFNHRKNFSDKCVTKFILKNLTHTSKSVKYCYFMDFNILLENNANEQDLEMIRIKFKHIKWISISKQIEDEKSIQLLKKLNPFCLKLDINSVNDLLINYLIEYNSIRKIIISNLQKDQLDKLYFLYKIRNLNQIQFECFISIEFVLSAFRNLNCLFYVQMYDLIFTRNLIILDRSSSKVNIIEFSKEDELFEFIEKTKLGSKTSSSDVFNELNPFFQTRKPKAQISFFNDKKILSKNR